MWGHSLTARNGETTTDIQNVHVGVFVLPCCAAIIFFVVFPRGDYFTYRRAVARSSAPMLHPMTKESCTRVMTPFNGKTSIEKYSTS